VATPYNINTKKAGKRGIEGVVVQSDASLKPEAVALSGTSLVPTTMIKRGGLGCMAWPYLFVATASQYKGEVCERTNLVS